MTKSNSSHDKCRNMIFFSIQKVSGQFDLLTKN